MKMFTPLISVAILLGILSGTGDANCSVDFPCSGGRKKISGFKPSKIDEEGLSSLTGLKYPLKDAAYYLQAFMEGREEEDVQVVAKEMDWYRVKEVAQNGGFVEELKKKACSNGKRRLKETLGVAQKLKESGVVVHEDQPAFKHQTGFQMTSNRSREMTKNGLITEAATRTFKEVAGISDKATTGLRILKPVDSCREGKSQTEQTARQTAKCDPWYPYRTMDGSCNNLNNVLQGAAFMPHRRILFPDYADSISAPRRDINGDALPSARLVSITINRLPNTESPERSIFHMTYGQFLDHDFTFTPITRFSQGYGGNQPISCCDPNFTEKDEFFTNEIGCFPIEIPAEDPFYACHGQQCMEFKRSAPASTNFLGPREQINELSSYIDGSMIYSVNLPKNPDPLRTLTDGLLNVQSGDLLPPNTNKGDGCNTPDQMAQGHFCFLAGDGRLNEQTWLTFFHTVWGREHNRIATILKGFQPTYNDEQLYQETRRIVGAQLQHVSYNEFLPTVLPDVVMDSAGLKSQTGPQQTNHYDINTDATIANSFGAATFRFGHSQVGDFHHRVNSYGTIETLEFSSTFFNPFYLYIQESMGNLARGSLQSRSRQVDSYFTKEVSGKLFRGDKPFGLDLVALNIQRGRDHGIPGYTKWLDYCGNPVGSFSDLTSVMTPDSVVALESVYNDVNDIDLFAGAMSETPVSGGFLGYTFTCLLTDQFVRLKFGDRFWYEEENQAGSFKPDQMEQLHQVTLARILCNNIPELKYIQRYPLLNPGPDNPIMPCDCPDIPDYSLKPWA